MAQRLRHTLVLEPGFGPPSPYAWSGLPESPETTERVAHRLGLHGEGGLLVPDRGYGHRLKSVLSRRSLVRRGLRHGELEVLSRVAALLVNEHTGNIQVLDREQRPLDPQALMLLLRVDPDGVRQSVDEQIQQHQQRLDGLVTLHHCTPAPGEQPLLSPMAAEEPEPAMLPFRAGLWERFLALWSARRRACLASRRRQWQEQQQQVRLAWLQRLHRHAGQFERLRRLYQAARQGQRQALEGVLAHRLSMVPWPRVTQVAFQLSDDLRGLTLEVDVPDPALFPYTKLRPHPRGAGVLVTWLSDGARRRLHREHAHATGVRLIGEALAAIPQVHWLVLSAHGRGRAGDPVRGHYLYSVRVERGGWRGLVFEEFSSHPPERILSGFEYRQTLDGQGNWRPVQPFSAQPPDAP
ncbi:hypothetical protein ACRYJU_08850 [Alloalcanivorax xenomutans]|uniref:hypothetical protein n=1 Tax=Alloalcanivorax xenomutans TaxID=1094342 RepID=UPI003D9B6763